MKWIELRTWIMNDWNIKHMKKVIDLICMLVVVIATIYSIVLMKKNEQDKSIVHIIRISTNYTYHCLTPDNKPFDVMTPFDIPCFEINHGKVIQRDQRILYWYGTDKVNLGNHEEIHYQHFLNDEGWGVSLGNPMTNNMMLSISNIYITLPISNNLNIIPTNLGGVF